MNFINNEVLIITSSIKPSKDIPFLVINEPQERLFQTYCCLISYIKNTKIKNIILCDNTGIDDKIFSSITQFAQEHGKHIEILVFEGNYEKVKQYGKGFGEGEIMKYVIEKSKLLQKDTVFYKITGRIFVSNFNTIVDYYYDQQVVFDCLPITKIQRRILWELAASHQLLWKLAATYQPLRDRLRGSEEGFVSTLFYKCSVKYYTDNLINCFNRVNDKEHFYLENSFFLPLIRNGFHPLTIKPLFVGKSGTKGILYGDSDYGDDIKNLSKLLLSHKG